MGKLLQNIIFVLLQAEESTLILLQHAGVVVDLTLKHLVGILGEYGGVEGSFIEHATLV